MDDNLLTAIMRSHFDEPAFRKWYDNWARVLQLDPDPDSPAHYYDYRAAFKAGAVPDRMGHWPSTFKRVGHPNRFAEGIDTITGQPMIVPSHKKKR